MSKYTLPAVIFAGGKSSRMGEDKALLPFGDCNTLAQYQFQQLSRLFENVYLSVKNDKFDFQAPLILDRYEATSPLVGLVSLFETLDTEYAFILSVDTPFVDDILIGSLLQKHKEEDAVIARSPSGSHPLCGCYRRTILPLAKKHLAKAEYKMGHLLQKAVTSYVDVEERKMMNLNYPQEYIQARKITS